MVGALEGGSPRLGDDANYIQRGIACSREKGREMEGVGEVHYLKVNLRDLLVAATTRRWLGIARRTAVEHGHSKSDGEGRKWGMNQVASIGAKLTVAKGMAGPQHRRRNELKTTEQWQFFPSARVARGWVGLYGHANEGGGEQVGL